MQTVSTGFYALGYLVGLAAFVRMARARSIDTSGVMATMQAAVVGGLIAANLAQWVVGGSAGRTILGGIAGGYLAAVLVKRQIGLLRHTGDLFAVALCAAEAVGRFGCLFGGCCFGRGTDVPWAVFQHGALRHPTQLYMSLACLLILVALRRFALFSPPEDALLYLCGTLYSLARFAIEFYRVSQPAAAGLTAAQWACIAGFAFSAFRLRALMRSPVRGEKAHPAALAAA